MQNYNQNNSQKNNQNNNEKRNNTEKNLDRLIQSQQGLMDILEKFVSMQMNHFQNPVPAYPMFYPMQPYPVQPQMANMENSNTMQSEKEIEAYKEETFSLLASLSSVKEKLRNKENLCQQYQNNCQNYKKEIDTLKQTIEQMKHKESNQDEGKIHSLENEITNLNNVVQKKNAEIEELQTKIEEYKKNLDSVENTQDTEALKEKEQEIALLKENLEKKEEKIDSLYGEVSKWKEEFDDMEYFAYCDERTDGKNAKAFNSEFQEMELSDIVLGTIAIDGLDELNLNYGKENGGNVAIERLYTILENEFSRESIYRISGGQFFIVCQGESWENLHKKLSDIKASVEEDGVHVTIATVNAGHFSEHADVVQKLDETFYNARKNIEQQIPHTDESTQNIPEEEGNHATTEQKPMENSLFNNGFNSNDDDDDDEDNEEDTKEMKNEGVSGIKDVTDTFLWSAVDDYNESDDEEDE